MKRLLTVTILAGLLTLFKMLMGFIIAKAVAVNTGPAGMALIGQVQSIVAGLTGAVNSPGSVAVVRYTSEHHSEGVEKCSPWWRASVYWTLVILGVMVPCGVLFSNNISSWLFNTKEYWWLIILVMFCLPFSALGNIIISVINGKQSYKKYMVLGFVSTLLSGALMLFFIYKYNIRGALIACAMQSGITGIIVFLACFREQWIKPKLWFGSVDREHKNKVFSYILMSLISAISMPATLIIVRNVIIANDGWSAAGEWQAVWKISEAYLGVITIALGTYFLPKISALQNMLEIKRITNQFATLIIPAVILMAVIIYFSRDFAIKLLFTSDFLGARELFLVQLVGDVIKIICWLYSYSLLSKGIVKQYIFLELLYSVVFVISAYIFVPMFGVSGANYAYCLAYLIYLFATLIIVKSLSKSTSKL
ncbi:O-antigen translocase [Citrobacter freundii]|uniref:O-antigen translocase n=1 Tax=Citrobacter freundii TaxID=546 RepID=UPI0013D5ECDA|nr:O-antigen translocase [Citrobacter freundii]EKX5679213.1 O-antigen translocase [Citrobacter freundii]